MTDTDSELKMQLRCNYSKSTNIFFDVFSGPVLKPSLVINESEPLNKYIYSFKNDILKFEINSEWNVTTYSLLMYTLRCLNYFHSLLLVTCCARDTEKMLHHSQSSRTLNPIFLINDWTRGVRVYWYLR